MLLFALPFAALLALYVGSIAFDELSWSRRKQRWRL
jgi:hypothetical protein